MISKKEEEHPEIPELPELPRVEVVRRLRERLEPILLFGESESDAEKRLRSIEVKHVFNLLLYFSCFFGDLP